MLSAEEFRNELARLGALCEAAPRFSLARREYLLAIAQVWRDQGYSEIADTWVSAANCTYTPLGE